MTSSKVKTIEERIQLLEDTVSGLKKNELVQLVPPKKEKKPREPSKYNIFVQEYISKNKDSNKSHKELFSEAAKAWQLKEK